jgi:hypothetical protein
MPFFDGLRTVKCSLRRHKNRVLRVERGDGGRVVPVERRVMNAASYFIANARICWAICGSAVSFFLARTGTANPIANPARASSTLVDRLKETPFNNHVSQYTSDQLSFHALSVVLATLGNPTFNTSDWSANRLFRNLPSHRKYQRRILTVVLITETERQRLWRARGIILTKIWLVEVFEQIDWSGVGTEEP